MKNTIYLDSDFNFLLLENEEEDTGLTQNKIYINIPTSAAANQALDISVAGGAPITVSIPSSAKVNFELSQQYWADNGDVEITPKNDDITGDTITIHFPESFMVSAALNYVFDDEFEIVAQNENFAEGGSSSGSGSGSGSAFDFVETIRNIGFRLLDEPSNVNAYFDEIAEEVQIKWTDPADISTNEPAPAEWAGTVVVRKEGSAPLHRWDGDLIVDSTTRDQYASNALVDNTLDISKNYYYGIFPYDTKGDYRFTKVIAITSQPITAPQINSLSVALTSITVNYSVASGYSYDYITLVYKKNSAPADKTDGTAVSLSASNTSINITGLDEQTTYYFKIFAIVTGASTEMESNSANATTGEIPTTIYTYEQLRLNTDTTKIAKDFGWDYNAQRIAFLESHLGDDYITAIYEPRDIAVSYNDGVLAIQTGQSGEIQYTSASVYLNLNPTIIAGKRLIKWSFDWRITNNYEIPGYSTYSVDQPYISVWDSLQSKYIDLVEVITNVNLPLNTWQHIEQNAIVDNRLYTNYMRLGEYTQQARIEIKNIQLTFKG